MEFIERITIQKKVFEIVATICGRSYDKLDEDKDLYRDLKIWGDAVDDLLLNFSKEFHFPIDKIDVSGCFPGEAHMFNPLPTLLFKPKRRIRIKHLVDAVLLKKWPDLEKI